MGEMIRSRKIAVICAALFFLVILTTHISSGIFARYTTEKDGGDNAIVAHFIFDAQGVDSTELDISSIKNPGDTAQYKFNVSNTDGVNVCEVAQEYTVKVTAEGNMPLVCTLTRGSDTASLNTTGIPATYTASLSGELIAATEQTEMYTLDIEWPSSQKSAEYANGMAICKVTLTITSLQKD